MIVSVKYDGLKRKDILYIINVKKENLSYVQRGKKRQTSYVKWRKIFFCADM